MLASRAFGMWRIGVEPQELGRIQKVGTEPDSMPTRKMV
jgi:hypothetical protein